jgi:predicted lipoprotein with Yx(FWY)xxD motif
MLGGSSIGLAQDYGDATLAMTAKEPYGEYLTDSAGRSLYMLEEDKKGQSTCYDACVKVWPPLAAEGTKIKVQGVDKSLVGLIERKDGLMQVTYDGMPLYYYVKDERQPGSTKGHDVHDEFGEWYLITPAGNKVAAQPQSETQGLGAQEGQSAEPQGQGY